MFLIIFIATFVISAVVISAISNAFMRLIGADMYFFSARNRITICAIIALIVAVLITAPG